ncbi:MAG: SMC-Scp complex subunit ScpB [Eubacteriales bacterium]|nr:SMC-Scp complex subunit ScpB [Eubacteriales bacterium]
MDKDKMKSALTSMLFIWGDPLSARDAAEALDADTSQVKQALEEIADDFARENKGLIVRRIKNSWQLVTAPENEEYIKKLCTPVKKKKLTQAALEVLAIVAYRQPVTKGQIDEIRGVKCDRVLAGLEEKELVKVVGRSDSIGKPYLYGTTDEFLRKFGFSSIKDLPEIGGPDEIVAADSSEDQLALEFDELEEPGEENAGESETAGSETAENGDD